MYTNIYTHIHTTCVYCYYHARRRFCLESFLAFTPDKCPRNNNIVGIVYKNRYVCVCAQSHSISLTAIESLPCKLQTDTRLFLTIYNPSRARRRVRPVTVRPLRVHAHTPQLFVSDVRYFSFLSKRILLLR